MNDEYNNENNNENNNPNYNASNKENNNVGDIANYKASNIENNNVGDIANNSVSDIANKNANYDVSNNANMNYQSYEYPYMKAPYGQQYSQIEYSETDNQTDDSQYNNKTDMEGSKPKKGRGFLSVAKLTAAAIAFGMIAGATFQGFDYFITKQDVVKEPIQNEAKEVQSVKELDIPKTEDRNAAVPVDVVEGSIITDVSGVVENVMPAIVAINSSATLTDYDFFGREINQEVAGSGSGIIIGQNGSEILIVTNNHVINGAQEVEIVFADESTATATIKGAESKSDLAVVAVSMDDITDETASAIKVATLGSSDDIKAGEMSIAIGNALGYGQSVTVGYISALDREVILEEVTMKLLQTDAAINPGNSGGALLNAQGEVIGINSVKYSSSNVEGMGYAIPISDAIPIINELMERETLEISEQGFLGINTASAQEVSETYADRFQMPIGIYVIDIVKDSPADVAGLLAGSIIVGINDKKIETVEDLISFLSYTRAGEEITLVIQIRENGEFVEQKLTVTLGNRPVE